MLEAEGMSKLVQSKLNFQRKDSTEALKRKNSNIESPDQPSKMSREADVTSDDEFELALGTKKKKGNEEEELPQNSREISDDEDVQGDYGQSEMNERHDFDEDSHEGSSQENSPPIRDSANFIQTALQYGQSASKTTSWGCEFKELPLAPGCYKEELPTLRAGDPRHNIFFIPIGNMDQAQKLPQPWPGEFKDVWFDSDSKTVKMPCSNDNIIPTTKHKPDGTESRIIRRWDLIEGTLKGPIPDSFSLEEAILKYNQHYVDRWNFDGLHKYFHEGCTEEESHKFFTSTLPKMITLLRSLPKLFKTSIPFLKQREERMLTFSQQQVACLLANAFFCTFPRRNVQKRHGLCPDINFSSLFAGSYHEEQKNAKIKCLIHYFERVTTDMPKGVITYARRKLTETVNWKNRETMLTKLHMSQNGTIEDDGKYMLQVDFANKYIGGGVLGQGCVQEEIRFLICPEMIISKLFTEVLLDNEVLVMTGCERFSRYKGYSKSFQWDGDYVDDVQRDQWGRLYNQVVAIDALNYKAHMNQLEERHIERELNKAYIGFLERDRDSPAAVCTGNWGCGAFGGDPELKVMIQIMAASKAKRDVCYLSVGDVHLCRKVSRIHEGLKSENISVGEIFDMILNFSTKFYHYSNKSLLKYIANNCSIPLEN